MDDYDDDLDSLDDDYSRGIAIVSKLLVAVVVTVTSSIRKSNTVLSPLAC
jgi:hypothetical protein